MIAICKEKKTKSVPAWHASFLTLLPAIVRYASIAFGNLKPEAREEAVQEAVCNTLVAYHRLVELGKADLAYASVLARYAVAQVRSGRQVGGRLNGQDVLSPYASIRSGISVHRLDRFDRDEDGWQEIVVEDRQAGPADVAACRIDVADWLGTLSRRKRKIATTLASGETTKAAAKRHKVSAGRVSQIRRELAESWRRFHGRTEHQPPKENVSPDVDAINRSLACLGEAVA